MSTEPEQQKNPPLPLVDGALLIDNSTLELLKCPRLLEYEWLRKRSLVAAKAGRNFGSAMHVGWARRYELCGVNAVTPEAVVDINEQMRLHLEGHQQPEGDFRDFNHACTVMKAYNDAYGNEGFHIVEQPAHCANPGKPIIEEGFAIPIGMAQNIPVIYCGKIDLAIQNAEGVWSFDHKTAFQFGESFQKQMEQDGGQLGYCWALGQILGKKPIGYIIDAVRVRRPTKKDTYAGVAPVDGTDFYRIPRWVSQADLDDWKADVLAMIADILWHHDRNYFPRHRWQCVGKYGACDFYDVCSAPKEQREAHLANEALFEADTWSPLKQPKKESEESK